MFEKIIGILIVISLHGCATPGTTVGGSSGTQHTFSLDTGKKLSFNTSGCKVEGGSLKNDGGYASSGSYGTLIVTNSKSKATIDKYRVSCGALPAGGKSSCVIQHIEGDGTFKDYGGLGCPDMSFNLINFRAF